MADCRTPAHVAKAEHDDPGLFDCITLADLMDTDQVGNDYVI